MINSLIILVVSIFLVIEIVAMICCAILVLIIGKDAKRLHKSRRGRWK